MNQDSLKKTVTSIFDALINSTEEETKKEHLDRIQELVTNNEKDLTKLDYWHLFIDYKLDNILRECVKTLYPNLNFEQISALYFLHKNYTFMESHLENLIMKKEGGACRADKSAWLLERYKNYILTKKLPDMSVEDRCYWKPRFGTSQQWIDFCENLRRLYYGNPEEYLKSLKNFLSERT
ncbi:MAG: hypothetical protein ACOCQR_01000 [bacterium]